MTWDPTNPLASAKIRAWPGAVTTKNWPQLATMISADHQFNNTPAAGDNSGFHKVARWVLQAGVLGDNTPAVGTVTDTPLFYSKALTYRKQGGAASTRQVLMQQPGSRTSATEETAIGAAPIKAAASFDTGGNIVGAALNIDSVLYTAALNRYRVTMVAAVPMLSTDYIVVATKTGGTSQFISNVVKNSTTQFDIFVVNNDGDPNLTASCDFIVLGGWATV